MERSDDLQAVTDDVRGSIRPALSRMAMHGVLWLLIQSLGGRTATLLSQIALAWILSPASFGIIGLVYAVTTLSAALVNFGIDDVMQQRAKALRLWSVPAFWTSLGLSMVGFLATVLIAWIGSLYYGAREIRSLAIIVGLTLPLTALQMIPTVILKARMDFKTLSLYNLSEVAAIQVGTVLLALAGAGVFSFVVPAPIVAIVKLAALWRLAPSPIVGRFRPFQVAYLLNSGTAVFLVRLIIAAISQGGYVILGLMASKLEVGIYYFAFKLSAQPLLVLAGNFTGVLFPTLVKLRAEPERQVAAAVKAAYLLSYIIMPLCFLQAALADPGLRLLFGAKWAASIPVTQILSIGLAFDAVTWITGTLLSANRDYYRALSYTAVFAPLFFILVALGAHFGEATGTALGVSGYYLVMGPVSSLLVFRHYETGRGYMTDIFLKPTLIAGVSMGLAASSARYGPDLVRAVQIGVLGPLLYVVGLSWFEPAILAELVRRLAPGRAQSFDALQARLRSHFRSIIMQTVGLPSTLQKSSRAIIPPVAPAVGIPRIIHQTIASKSGLSDFVSANIAEIKLRNKGWDHRLYDDDDARQFVLEAYGSSILERFDRISPRYGVAKADLFRYLLLYKVGGVYLDVKSGTTLPLDEVLKPDDGYILAQWRNRPGDMHEGFGMWPELDALAGGEYQQWHIIAAPGHPFLKAVIGSVLANIDSYDPWRFGTGGHGVLRVTGPIAYTLAIAPIRQMHAHRLLTSEQDVSLVYSMEHNLTRIRTSNNHYTTRTDAIVTLTGFRNVSAVVYSIIKHIGRRYKYRNSEKGL